MADRTIPVDLWNPGQVFACLGFLEGAESLLGDAEGGFDWSDPTAPRFRLSAGGDDDGTARIMRHASIPRPFWRATCEPARRRVSASSMPMAMASAKSDEPP